MRFLFLISCLFLFSCDRPEKTLKVIATPVPHAVMLEEIAKPLLAAQGIELDIIVVEDYYIANRAVAEGEADANFFQHDPFLQEQISQCHYSLSSLTAVHIEPLGIYSSKFKNLEQIKKIALPIDPSNKKRALLLIEKAGISPQQIIEVDSVLLVHSYKELDGAIIPTNYALQAGLKPDRDALIKEGCDSPYANIIVIRTGEDTRPEIQALKKAMTGPELHAFIETYYEGSITPIH
ncbi:MAG: MetQ/NlpA family ABC transporter substrate-binding protein [Chlamydiota bacterium]